MSVLRRWFCCCWFIVKCTSRCLWGFCDSLFVLLFVSFCPFLLCNHLDEEDRAARFALIVSLVSCECYSSRVGLQFVLVVFPDHTHLLFDMVTAWHTDGIPQCCFFKPIPQKTKKRIMTLREDQKKISRIMRFPTIKNMRPAKPQISLRIRAVWSEPLLVAWIFYEC